MHDGLADAVGQLLGHALALQHEGAEALDVLALEPPGQLLPRQGQRAEVLGGRAVTLGHAGREGVFDGTHHGRTPHKKGAKGLGFNNTSG
ncbi:hypothetical protein D3C78_1824900 [compost metagenome]